MDGKMIVTKIVDVIINPIILLLFATGFVLFLWGLVVFMAKSDSSDAKKTGVNHMMWGIAGMFIMVAVYSIIEMVLSTFNISLPRV